MKVLKKVDNILNIPTRWLTSVLVIVLLLNISKED